MIAGIGVLMGAVLLAVLWLPALSELLCLLRRRAQTPDSGDGTIPRLIFLVPAHNEELLIGECVVSLLRQTYPIECRRVVVVADNCQDRTASLARELGAECLERTAPDAPGKPQAIAWALEEVDFPRSDTVIIIDADSVVASDFGWAIARCGSVRQKVMQANFLISNENETWLTRLGGVIEDGAAAKIRN